MSELAAIIESASSREVEANRSLALEDPQSVWIVSEGAVDVFAVPIAEGDQPGRRTHLGRVEAGGLLCGCRGGEKLPRLIAVGFPGTKVVELKRDRIDELLKDEASATEFARLLDDWIEQLTVSISHRRLPNDALPLEPGRAGSLKAGSTASPVSGVSWIIESDGAARFLGRLGLPTRDQTSEDRDQRSEVGSQTSEVEDQTAADQIRNPQSAIRNGSNGAFPISKSGWIEVSEKTKLRSASTASLLKEPRLWSGLQEFHELILEGAVENARLTALSEYARLEHKTRAEIRLTESALSELAAVTKPDDDLAPLAGDADPLLVACRLVGEQAGVTILAPRDHGEKKSSDPVGAIARVSAARTRRIVLSNEWWRQDNGPLLGFLKDGEQPVALLPTSASSYELVNPTTGERGPVTQEVAPKLKPFGYMFYRSFPAKPLTAGDVFRFGLRGTKRDWLYLLVLGIAAGLLGLLIPAATGWIVGDIIPGGERSQLLLIVLALTVAAIVTVLFEFVQGVAMLRVETRMDGAVEAAVWDRLLNLPASFFRKYTAGDLAMRAMGIGYIRQAITQSATASLLAFLSSLVFFTLLFYYNTRLALLASVIFLIIVIATAIAVYYQLPYERAQQRHRGRVWGIVLQLFSGISRLRIAGAENRALAYWARNYSQQTRASIRSQMVGNNLESFMAALPVIAPLVIFASVALFPTDMSVAAFLAFNVAFIEVIGAAITMSGTVSTVLDVVPLFERAQSILESPPEFDRSKRDPGDLTGEIEISHVSFRYNADSPLVLEDVSLHVKPGEFVAFVGPSGAGKSTVLRLLLGFEIPTSGSIYYDREDVAGLDQLAVRRQIGVVLQDSRLMPGDIFENIVGSAPLTHDDAWEAARLSGLDEDIKQMPMGMYTVLSDAESTLSGGQRQRLLIARAIVKKPKILFFDEATSALDNVTQTKVSQSLENLKATRIVIAHRLSTIMNADRIYVIDRGRIVEQGTYQELMDQDGVFVQLAQRQLA